MTSENDDLFEGEHGILKSEIMSTKVSLLGSCNEQDYMIMISHPRIHAD